MRRLGHRISRQTVKNILVEAGLGPDPSDHPDTWSDFLKRHAATMWQYDFASKRKWTIKGMVDLYILVFIHIETRRIWVSPCTANPTGEWTTQQARNFEMYLQDEGLPCEIQQRDQDSKYVGSFDEIFLSTGCKIKKTCPRSPNLQAFVERVIQTLKHEVFNAFCVVSEMHLDHILRVFRSTASSPAQLYSRASTNDRLGFGRHETPMKFILQPWQLMLIILASWVNRQQ
jgi:putative transposase